MIWILLATPIAFFALGLTAFFYLAPQIGGLPQGKRLQRLQASPNYRKGKFHNLEETIMKMPPGMIPKIIWDSNKPGVEREPTGPIPNLAFDREKWIAIEASETAVCWLGHSSLMLKIDGRTFLFDPVFGKRASMFSFAGPKHFTYAHPIQVSDLPPIDALILSHDHYDHLDYPTVIQLKGRVDRIYTALGVGAHFEKWGFPIEQIVELDWWEELAFDDRIRLVATPSRHFSGRGLTTRFSTLWSSWVIAGSRHKVFFGSDSGYHSGFKKIGEQYGPFDLTLLECGAYSKYWPEIHNTPEEAAQAHLDLRGKTLTPIHWAKFSLAQHAWTEPAERLSREAERKNIALALPRIGQIFLLDGELPQEVWWK